MDWLKYTGKLFKLAFRLSFSRADTISGFAIAILYGIGKLSKVEAIMNIDLWWFPLIVLGTMFAIRLLLTPYWVYKDKQIQIADLETSLSQAEKERDEARSRLFATPDELIGQTLRGLSIRIADLARDDFIIRGRTFEDCHIYGPACIAPLGTTFITGNSFDAPPDAVFIGVEQDNISGAIGVEDCVFRRCTFKRIGIIGPSDYIEEIKKGL